MSDLLKALQAQIKTEQDEKVVDIITNNPVQLLPELSTKYNLELDRTKRVIDVDSMMISKIQRCPREAHYKFERNLGSNYKPDYFAKGILVHDVMEGYYTSRRDNNPYHIATKAGKDKADQHYICDTTLHSIDEEEKNHCINCAIECIDLWRNDGWKILNIESPYTIKLYEDDEIIITHSGIIDLIAESQMGKFVCDHKSQERKTDYHRLNNQFIGYANATGLKLVTVNNVGFQKSLKPVDKHRRNHLFYDEIAKAEWRYDVVRSILEHVAYIDEKYYPMRFEACKFCDYKLICESTPESREMKIKHNFTVQEKWDVYNRN